MSCLVQTHTLSANCDQTFFLSVSYSPFFLIVCNMLSMDDFCVEVNGSSEALNRFRGTEAGSSSLCLPAMAFGVAIAAERRMSPGPLLISLLYKIAKNAVADRFLRQDAQTRRRFAVADLPTYQYPKLLTTTSSPPTHLSQSSSTPLRALHPSQLYLSVLSHAEHISTLTRHPPCPKSSSGPASVPHSLPS